MKSYQEYLDSIGEFGIVTQVNHPIVVVEGLPSVRPHEVILFQTGEIGEVFTVRKDTVEILTFSKVPVQTGVEVVRTGEVLSIPVGEQLLGTTIDPLGNSLGSSMPKGKATEIRPIDIEPSSIATRAKIKKPLRTGISMVDMLIPIGRGQRELVIGDRKTGKSLFLLDTLANQVKDGSIAIYAAIGKKKSEIRDLETYFQKNNLTDKVILVASSSYDAATMIYLTPYAAITLAEYFRDKGQDTIVILDDLSTHARFYREISLLAKNFPGRDSYPGDIFHTHAKLLERAGNFINGDKEIAITCLPVVETVEGDITGYIATNIMSMTDGHIFFDSNIFYEGRRPAINNAISVTRVGKQIHTSVEREINRQLLSFLTLYEKTQNLSHFGAELSEHIKTVLGTGDKIYQFFDQPSGVLLPPSVQLVFFAMLWAGFLDNMPLSETRKIFNENAAQPEVKSKLDALAESKTFNELLAGISKEKEALLALCKSDKSLKS